MLIRVDSIHKRILKRKEEVPLPFADFLLMHPYFLQSSLKGQTVITTKGDQSQAVLNSCKLILGIYHGIVEWVVTRVDEYLFDNVQFIVDVDCAMRDLIENGEGDLQFVMMLNFEGEDVGGGIDADDWEVTVSTALPAEELEGRRVRDGVRDGCHLATLR